MPQNSKPGMCTNCGEAPAECMGGLCFQCDHLLGELNKEFPFTERKEREE